jgi:hypothetical protein
MRADITLLWEITNRLFNYLSLLIPPPHISSAYENIMQLEKKREYIQAWVDEAKKSATVLPIRPA